MIEAIHKSTKKRVSAFKLANSLEWQGKERDEFIAPFEGIGNIEELLVKGTNEVKVSFVKKHKRYEGTDKEETVSEHFRIETPGAIENYWGESEEHKLSKKYIYDNIDKIKIINFENKSVPELANIEDITIERGVGVKRADVLITFKEWHPIFGRGIAFEVQISPQKKDETKLRSYDRAAYGFSVVWIWSEDLRDFKNIVKLIPFQDAIQHYNEFVSKQQDDRLSEIAVKSQKFINKITSEVNGAVNSNLNVAKNNLDSVINLMNTLKGKIIKETADEIYKEMNQKIEEIVIGNINENTIISTLNKSDVVNKMIESFVAKNIEESKKEAIRSISSNMESAILKEILNLKNERIKEININEILNGTIDKQISTVIKLRLDIIREKYGEEIARKVKENLVADGYPEDWAIQCKKCSSWNCHKYTDMILCLDCKNKEVSYGRQS
jgi:hypothetical protein